MKAASLFLGLVVVGLAPGCLDFDQFVTEPTTGVTTSAGGGGANQGGDGGSGGIGGSGGEPGVGGGGGEGGGSWMPPATEPCFVGAPVSETFAGPMLNWIRYTGTVDYSTEQAVFTGVTVLELDRADNAGPLDECHFQLELVQAGQGVVYVQFRSVASELTENLTFRLRNGTPEVEIAPGSGNVPLLDNTIMTSGFLRFGESGGTYFVATAAAADGPWVPRYLTTTVPAWFGSDGFLVLGLSPMGGTPTAIFDNLNVP